MEKGNKQTDREQYISRRAFTIGHFFAQFEPDFMKELAKVDSKAPVMESLRAGKAQFELEQKAKETEHLPQWLQKDRVTKAFNKEVETPNKNLQKDRDKEHDR